jgi:regulator of sigma E protease
MSAVYFILLLGGLILIHELGHFLVAKASGVRVLTFSIGFGPALLKKKWGDTEYKIAAIPLGGFVRMHGDEPGQEVAEEDREAAFNYKPLWKRTAIVLAGPVANLLLPFFVFFFMFLTHSELLPAYIGAVAPGGPAWEAGIRSGDVITRIDGEEISYWWEMEERINDSIGNEMAIEVKRGDEEKHFKVVPVEVEVDVVKHVNLVDREGRIQVTPVFVEPVVCVQAGGAAQTAGLQNWDRIVKIDGELVSTYVELERKLKQAEQSVTLTVLREEPIGGLGHGLFQSFSEPFEVVLEPIAGELDLWSAEMVVHSVDAGSAAEDLGLRPGDRIISVDGYGFPLWQNMENDFAALMESERTIVWFDGEKERSETFSLLASTEKGEFNEERQVVVFGAHNHSDINAPDVVPNAARLSYAFLFTWKATRDAFRATVASVGGLIIGRVPIKEMGGPILIYDMASKTEKFGWPFFFNLMAWLSISLGIINLFPIPILDGGHLFFFAIEAVTRREVPIKVRQIAAYFGLACILALMVTVFWNDIARNWGTISNWF